MKSPFGGWTTLYQAQHYDEDPLQKRSKHFTGLKIPTLIKQLNFNFLSLDLGNHAVKTDTTH